MFRKSPFATLVLAYYIFHIMIGLLPVFKDV